MIKKVWFGWLLIGLVGAQAVGQTSKERWVDSVFTTLDLQKKIGQIIMIPVNSLSEKDRSAAESLVKATKIGGLVFTKGGPVTQVNFTNHMQHHASIPLLVGMYAEEGLGASLDSTLHFPPPIMQGAIREDSLLYYLGGEIGRQLKRLGVHLNFGPTADLSSSFNDEALINTTYGSYKDRVALKVVMYAKGLQKSGVQPVAIHYPDNGLRVQGFQKGNPVLQAVSNPQTLFPLQQLFENNITGVAMAYQQVPMLPSRKGKFASKKAMVTAALPTLYSGEYFKQQLKFSGVVYSYLPDVKALNKRFKPGDAEVFALRAGNDVLLFPENINAATRKLRKAIRKDKELEKKLDLSVKKVLAAKYDAGLNSNQQVSTENLLEDLTTPSGKLLKSVLLHHAVSIVKNEVGVLPLRQLENTRFASLSIGASAETPFSQYLSRYTAFRHFSLQLPQDTSKILEGVDGANVIVVAIHPYAATLESTYLPLLHRFSRKATLVVISFCNLPKISLFESLPTIVQAHIDEPEMQQITAQVLFGALPANGTLPLSINSSLTEGNGIISSSLKRLSYASPTSVGFDHTLPEKIAAIVEEAIEQKATPGCQVLVARYGKIVLEKSYGWQTYNNTIPIHYQSIYDLASITKVAATLPATMFLYEKGLIDIYKKASVYLPEMDSTNKKDLILKDILTHQAGLTPFIPFWTQTIKDADFLPQYYSRTKAEPYTLQIAPNLYGIKSLRDSLWQWTLTSKLREKPVRTPYPYVYSDLGLYIFHHLNEKLLNQPQEEFLHQNFYEPLGATTLGYLPLERFPVNQIVPTEDDKIFRKELLHGTVHDEGAALLGGIAGHAGLFGNALDLAKIGQMMLQQGYYGGHQYFKPETISYFTAKQFDTSRRGLGWDKPVQSEWNSPTSIYASPKTYGHTGFTGTAIWIDPEFDLLFIFLSNRVYPDRNVNKLSSLNIRSRIQDALYQSIFNYRQFGDNQPALNRFLQQLITESKPQTP